MIKGREPGSIAHDQEPPHVMQMIRRTLFVLVVVLALALAACAKKTDTTTTQAMSPTPSPSPTARNYEGLTTVEIETLQRELDDIGCFAGAVDGIVGPHTISGLEEFQRTE